MFNFEKRNKISMEVRTKEYLERLAAYLEKHICIDNDSDAHYSNENNSEWIYFYDTLCSFIGYICELAEEQHVENRPDTTNCFEYIHIYFIYNNQIYLITDMQGQGVIDFCELVKDTKNVDINNLVHIT